MEPKPRGEGLSPSSLTLYTNCQRRYFHSKVAKTERDKDFDDDVESLQVGKAFHKCLENCKHLLSGFGIQEVEKVALEHGLNVETHVPMLFAMLKSYKSMHEKAGLEAVACEVIVNTPVFYGVVDVVLHGASGWWLADMKTSASFNPQIIPTLLNHPQLNLYAAHYEEVAHNVGLDPRLYRGCRYRLTTKSKMIRKASEATEAYIGRMSKTIKSIDFILPKEKMRPGIIAAAHAQAKQKITAAGGEQTAFTPNYSNCLSYFRPCEFWSRCHGSQFTDMADVPFISSAEF